MNEVIRSDIRSMPMGTLYQAYSLAREAQIQGATLDELVMTMAEQIAARMGLAHEEHNSGTPESVGPITGVPTSSL
jgi:hypothetical protein